MIRSVATVVLVPLLAAGGNGFGHAAETAATPIKNWTNYRGPTNQGLALANRLPVSWSETENVRWKTAVDGKAWSSPVVWGDRIFLTNAPPEGSRLSVVCIDKQTGEEIYNRRLHTVALPQYCHPFNSYASPSPVVEGDRLYVSFGSPYNACLDAATGDVIWERKDFVCNHFRGAGSSPYVHGDRLYLHFDGADLQYVVALDKRTGETLWKTDRTVDFDDIDPETGRPDREGDWRKAYSTPIIHSVGGRELLISLGSMALYAYDPASGSEVWRVEFVGSHSGACRPVFHKDLVIIPTGSGAELWAIRPQGTGVLDESQIAWKYTKAVPRRPSPIVHEGLVFMVDDSGVAACVVADTGEEVWRKRVGGNFSASPILASGHIYFLDEDGKATVIKASRDYEVVAESELDEGFMASPAVSSNALLLRTRTHLYRIDSAPAGG